MRFLLLDHQEGHDSAADGLSQLDNQLGFAGIVDDNAGDGRVGMGAGCGLGDVLPLEGVVRAGGVAPMWQRRLHRRGATGAEGGRWRDAAGVVVLGQMNDRLAEDHARAKQLAEAGGNTGRGGSRRSNEYPLPLADEGGIKDPEEVMNALADRGVLLGRELGRFRAVTHYWISDADIEMTIAPVRAALP